MFDKKKRPEASVANYFKKLCVILPVHWSIGQKTKIAQNGRHPNKWPSIRLGDG